MFRVLWLQEALDELTQLWLDAHSTLRSAINAAVRSLDQQLESDPFRDSESRGENERVIFAYPLGLEISIDEGRRIVLVAHVWRFRRREDKS